MAAKRYIGVSLDSDLCRQHCACFLDWSTVPDAAWINVFVTRGQKPCVLLRRKNAAGAFDKNKRLSENSYVAESAANWIYVDSCRALLCGCFYV
jgi:hypothetical protein